MASRLHLHPGRAQCAKAMGAGMLTEIATLDAILARYKVAIGADFLG